MEMTGADIERRFRQAKDKKAQIKVLAELNDVSTAQIVDVLRVNQHLLGGVSLAGVDGAAKTPQPKKLFMWTPELEADLARLQGEGLTVKECAERLGVDAEKVKSKLNRDARKARAAQAVQPVVKALEAAAIQTEPATSPETDRPSGRARCQDEAKRIVCGDREDEYGSPEDCFCVIAQLWEAYIRASCAGKGAIVCVNRRDVAAMMALLKIARIAGGSEKADNWIDMAGYAACGCEIDGGG